MGQWFRALAAMAMLSAKTWVPVLPMTSGVFSPVMRFFHPPIKPQFQHLHHLVKFEKLAFSYDIALPQ